MTALLPPLENHQHGSQCQAECALGRPSFSFADVHGALEDCEQKQVNAGGGSTKNRGGRQELIGEFQLMSLMVEVDQHVARRHGDPKMYRRCDREQVTLRRVVPGGNVHQR